MTKRRRRGDLVAGCSADPPPQRHLYLVFDDWCWGCSIRKVDLRPPPVAADVSAEGVPTDAAAIDHTVRSLPPAIFSIEAPRDFPTYFASVSGTKIIAINPSVPDWHPCSLAAGRNIHPVAPMKITVYDDQSRAITIGPLPKALQRHPIYIQAGGDRLFALSGSSFEWLSLKEPAKAKRGGQFWVRPWRKLQDAPFKSEDVYAYTLHPDGQTLFFSVFGEDSISTFTFNMGNGGSRWEARGDWSLPFTGRAHYDHDLNAWVGISGIPDQFGYICICPVASTDSETGNPQCLDRKFSKEYLCGTELDKRLISCSLLYAGAGSQFCHALVIRSQNNADSRHFCSDAGNAENPPAYRYVLRLTTFCLKYDENGDLTTGNSLRIQNYNVPEGATESALERPFAFMM